MKREFLEGVILLKGTVKWFDPKKGYGFITTENGEDVFVHWSAIQTEGFKTLTAYESVEFWIQTGCSGLQAVNVRPLR